MWKGFLGRKKKDTTQTTQPIEKREDGTTQTTQPIEKREDTTQSENRLLFWFSNPKYELEDLLTASAEVLGKGTYGTSYKVKLKGTDSVVVKRLKDVSFRKKDFEKQMQTLGSISHENIAAPRGYFYSIDEKLVVYDYFEQGSVSDMLHGTRGNGKTPLGWNMRVKIIVGAARGIAYIHRHNGGKFVHGNINSSNVFLNSQGYGCVSDVGLAMVTNPIPLSALYKRRCQAPELTDSRSSTHASDVYSFGVLLLELLTGKSPIRDDVDLVRWVSLVVKEEWAAEVFDVELLRYQNVELGMEKLLEIGMSCVAREPEKRPKMPDLLKQVEEIEQANEPTMSKVTENLDTDARIPQATIESEPTLSTSFEDVPQATIESEPTLSTSFEDVPQATIEIEPTLSTSSEDVQAAEATTQPASQTFEPAPAWKYDLFLSFRGEDTREGFLSHLYHELQKTRAIRTFKDDEQLKKGKDISHSLLTAIEESRFAIIILSKNYASSTWCLNELTKICECMGSKETILPVFYYVNPSDVRNQVNSFEEAFRNHESRYDKEIVKNWRVSLKKVANIAGWDSKNHKTERDLVEDIVYYVSHKVLQLPKEEFEEFEAAKEAADEVTKALQDNKITVIGVHGRGGVGKTTMVKHVSANAKTSGLFDHVAMVVISRSPDLGQIQGTLADLLGLDLVEESQLGRANRLKEAIMGREKMLIILDDIWETIDLTSIGFPSLGELQRCNSKVILTTRIRDVCHSMGCQAQITLNILSEEDSWKLFMKESGKISREPTDSYEARMAVRECTGLPNALKEAAWALGHKYLTKWNKAVAEAFGDDNLDEWKEAAEQLKASQPVDNKDERDLSNIKIKYDTLISDDAKSCFLLCSLFPEDWDISIELLLKYGIGKGLFHCSDTMQEAREKAHSVVQHLKASKLLLDGTEKGCIRMPGDMRDLAMSIMLSELVPAFFVKTGCELKDWPLDAHDGYSGISLMANKLQKLPGKLVCSKLQILLLQSNCAICEIPETFIQSPNALRVFDLSFTSISFLPSSFSLLINLQALFLDCCHKIIDVSMLGKLKKLEILSMRGSSLKDLPKEIEHLTNLRVLDVTGGHFDTVPSNVISRLHRLEELYMKCGFGDWGSRVEKAVEETNNAEFNELLGLSYLNILKVNISDAGCLPKNIEYTKLNWVDFDICVSKDVPWEIKLPHSDKNSSRILMLDTTINSLPDWFNKVVTNRAEKLVYKDYMGLTDIFVEHDLGDLQELKHLSVNGAHEKLEVFMNAVTRVPNKPVFESLEELHILSLQGLKKLCFGEFPPGSLGNLKLLKVQTCRNLVDAFLPLNLLHRLLNLETVICVNMENMKYVFGSEGLETEAIVLERLREIRLCALPELTSLWNGPAPLAVFQNLKFLAVCDCKKLKNLFPVNVAQSLVQLKDLCVEHCHDMDRIIESSKNLDDKIVLLKLKKLALISLPELSWFCDENGTICIECPSLEYLYVDKCPKFSNSYSPSVQINDQQHLESIVKRWEEMHKL